MLILYRIHAQRATGRLEDALESIGRFTARPAVITDGWRGWHKGMVHLQLDDIDAAIESFSAPGAYDSELPTASDRANAAWFWSLVAERRGEHESAATLLGFADALTERASLQLLAFDQRLIDESRASVREALGDERYRLLRDRGMNSAWEDLPLIH